MDEALIKRGGETADQTVESKPAVVSAEQEHEDGSSKVKSGDTASEEVTEESSTQKSATDGSTVSEQASDANGEETSASDGVKTEESTAPKGEGSTVPADEVSDDDSTTNRDDEAVECRVQIQNLPRYVGFKQMKTFLSKKLGKTAFRKLRMFSDTVYFTMPTKEDADKVVKQLNGFFYKNKKMIAKTCPHEPIKGRDKPRPESEAAPPKTARQRVTPMADVDYEVELEQKMSNAKRIAANLVRSMAQANVKNARSINAWALVQPIRRSPKTEGYRNKCEFTIGHDLEGKVCVGFVAGRFAQNKHFTMPIHECDNISQRVKHIVTRFNHMVLHSGQEPFNEMERRGVWRLLSVREFTDDLLMIVTVFPMEDKVDELNLKRVVIEQFLRDDTSPDEDNKYKVNSIYWQRLINASDRLIYEHIAGSQYAYETILGTRFRISPGAFFQTNSSAAPVLYSTIAEKAGLLPSDNVSGSGNIPTSGKIQENIKREEQIEQNVASLPNETSEEKTPESEQVINDTKESVQTDESLMEETVAGKKIEATNEVAEVSEVSMTTTESSEKKREPEKAVNSDGQEEGVAVKRRKVEDGDETAMETSAAESPKATVILDICCGTGTIGLCLLSLMKERKAEGRRFLFGVEVVPQAIEDANFNAQENAFSKDDYCFVAGKAEGVFRSIHSYLPSSLKLDECNVVGILDPPRAGIHEKVVIGCRAMSSLRRLVFVSCEPSLAMKNLVDLCRPRSKKYEGDAFKVTSITPVDMFPRTTHCEWVVQLDR